jgi:transposase-like protein
MSDTHTPPEYRRCLPAELHREADAFIRYLHELPNQTPIECPECRHPHFRLDANQNVRLPFYRCAACNKGFNRLSKTPFSGYGLMHLWSTYAQYLLAGWSMPNIAQAMGISPGTTWRWTKPCRAVMTKEFPALYHWWSARQDRTNLEPPAHITTQAQAFLNGLEQLLTSQRAICSKCGSSRMQRIDGQRPDFRCLNCRSKLSLLRGTPLSRLAYPEHWLSFAQGLINGESAANLQRRTGLCGPACRRWQLRFTQMLEQQGHTELAQWILWLRSRRIKEVSDLVRDSRQLGAVAGSRYSAGTKRCFTVPPKQRRTRNSHS